MKTKLNELLEFPTPFTYKVMGQALPELVDQVVEVVQRHAPGDYTPTVKPSSKGNYHSVSITINATHIEHFFKQKTAYGILECDWSSDVCSSDLKSTLVKCIMREIEHEGTLTLGHNVQDRKSVV